MIPLQVTYTAYLKTLRQTLSQTDYQGVVLPVIPEGLPKRHFYRAVRLHQDELHTLLSYALTQGGYQVTTCDFQPNLVSLTLYINVKAVKPAIHFSYSIPQIPCSSKAFKELATVDLPLL